MRILADKASKRSIRSESGSPTKLASLIVSSACRQPITPGTKKTRKAKFHFKNEEDCGDMRCVKKPFTYLLQELRYQNTFGTLLSVEELETGNGNTGLLCGYRPLAYIKITAKC